MTMDINDLDYYDDDYDLEQNDDTTTHTIDN
jgi:hypothetical protein